MTTHDLSNMIFNIKEKLTDAEFKEIMEKLSIKHREEANDMYEFIFYKQKMVLERVDGVLTNVMKLKHKKLTIKIDFALGIRFEKVVEMIENGTWINRIQFSHNKNKNTLLLIPVVR